MIEALSLAKIPNWMIDNNGCSPKHIKTRLKVIVGPQFPNSLLKTQPACFDLGENRTFRP